MRIFSKPFFTNYIVHPLSKDLTKGERTKALISSIAIGIFSLGICQAVCAVKFHSRRTPQYTSKVIIRAVCEEEKIEARRCLKRLCPRDYRLEIEFAKDVSDVRGHYKRVLGVYQPTHSATDGHLNGTALGYATEPGIHRKTMVLVNCKRIISPVLSGRSWDALKDRIIYRDSKPTQEIKGFFAPFPEEPPEESQDAL